jgi:hypothetical protein
LVGGSTSSSGEALHLHGGARSLVERIESKPDMPYAELQSVQMKVVASLIDILGQQDWDVTVPMTHLGVRAGAYVAAQLSEMKERGYALPKSVRVFEDRDLHGTFYPGTREMVIAIPGNIPNDVSLDNAAKAAFHSVSESAIAASGLGREFTIESFGDVVTHEMGHVSHFAQSKPPMLWGKVSMPSPGSGSTRVADLRKVAASVSEYAATSPPEFVAEAFTWQYKGGKLSPEAAKLYQFLKGPEIKR